MWRTWGMVKGRLCHLPFHWSGGKENSHYGLLYLDDKSKRNRLQELVPCPIPCVPSAIRPIPDNPDLPVAELEGNMEYRSDSEHSDMTVVAGDDLTTTSQNPWYKKKDLYSAAGFTTQRETSVGTRNSVPLASKPWERIKTVFHVSE